MELSTQACKVPAMSASLLTLLGQSAPLRHQVFHLQQAAHCDI